MLETLNNRQRKILSCLLNGDGYISLDELSEVGECSTKTIQRDIRRLHEIETLCGFSLTKGGRGGIRIEVSDTMRDKLNYELKQSRVVLTGESVEQRRYKIYLDLLMCSPEPTTIAKLSEQYYVGKNSIVNDLMRIEEMAKQAGLVMEKTHNGTKILGREALIRNEIVGLVNTIRLSDEETAEFKPGRIDEDTRQMLNQIYGEREVHVVEHATELIELQLGHLVGDIYYINIITHILITNQRIRSRQYIDEENVIQRHKVNHEVYSIIKNEAKKMGELLGIVYPETEILFLYTHFVSAGYGELPNNGQMRAVLDRLDSNTIEFCRELVAGLETISGFSFNHDEGLLNYLMLHVNSMRSRIQYGVKIVCPLKEQIMQEFAEMYFMVREELLRMKKKYFPESYISEDEICYLCLYFQTFLDAVRNKKRILLVCSTGVGTSHFLKRKIEGIFPELEIADVISLKKLMSSQLTDIDFVVSTVRITEKIAVPIVNVSVLMDDKDTIAVSNMMVDRERKGKEKEMNIRSVLSLENVNLQLHGNTKEEVLREMSEMLYKNDCVTDTDDFVEELFKREEEGITGIGEGIAIPHGKSAVVKKTSIAVGRNLNGIEWETFDDKPVQIVIMFAVRDVDISQHIMLLSRVAELLCNKDVTKVLLTTTDTDTIIDLLGKEEE